MQAGVRGAARPGAPAADLVQVDRRARRRTQGIKVTDAEVKKSFDEQKKQSFPKDADYQKFLKDLRPDARPTSSSASSSTCSRTRSATRSSRARTRSPTPQIADFYNKNKARFAQPEQRDLRDRPDQGQGQGRAGQGGARERRVVEVRGQEVLDRHRRPRRRAASCRRSAKGRRRRRSTTRSSPPRRASSSARSRPSSATTSSTSTRSRRPSQQTLDAGQGRRSSRRSPSQNQQKALDTFVEGLPRSAGRTKTECRDGYKTQDCKNGPKATPTPTPAHRRSSQQQPTATATRNAGERLARATSHGASRASTRSPAACARECPWDREQDERSIVPHTVEEAYELAAAAHAGDDAKLLDELGDVLFQVHFLSLLLEERGAGSLAEVAEHVHAKLIRRHPHVFGEVEVDTAGEVLRNWDAIKRDEAGREPGIFGEVPENLPGPLYARKVAAPGGVHRLRLRARALRRDPRRARGARGGRATARQRFHEVGDVLFAAVNVARKLQGRSGARAARRLRALPRPRAGCRGPRCTRRRGLGRSGPDAQLGYYARRASPRTRSLRP